MNEAPVVVAGLDRTATFVPGGVVVALSGASFTDPDGPATHSAEVDWGDGSALEVAAVNEAQRKVQDDHRW